MSGIEGTMENKSSYDRPAKEGRNLTENREKMAKSIVKDLGEQTRHLEHLNPENDAIVIRTLYQLFNGNFKSKETEERVITYLNLRINEIRSKVSNGRDITSGDRKLISDILKISRDYKIKGLEIEWFKENKPFDKTKKGNIIKVDAKLIKEFTSITGTYWDKVLLLTLTGIRGLVESMLIENYRLRRLDSGLKKYNLSVHDLFEFVLSFQTSAVAKAEKMIFENRKIVRKERDRYSDNKNGAMDDLYNILTNTYASKFKIGDRLRAKGLLRCIKDHSHFSMERLISAPFLNNNYYKEFLRFLTSGQSEEKVAEYIARFPPNTAEYIALLIESYNPVNAAITKLAKPNAIRDKYSEFKKAQLADSNTIIQMRAADASKHPILNDVNIDYRKMARSFKGNPKGFKDEILKILSSREESANKTLEILYKTPAKVWELKPLIELTQTSEKINNGDNTGQLIRDRVNDEARGNTIRTVGMAAMGIGLGIAGFFTGGSAWAGFALAAGGAGLSGIDLYCELDNYKLHSNAAKATLGSEFSDDPGVLGVTLAILSLMVDIGSLGKAAKVVINSSAKLIAASDDVANTAKEAGKLFEELEAAKKIDTANVSKEEFIKTIQQAKETGQDIAKEATENTRKLGDDSRIDIQKKQLSIGNKEGNKEVTNLDKQLSKEYLTAIEDKVEAIKQQDLEPWVKETFKDGNYRTVIAKEEVIVYRTFGGRTDAWGKFATTSPAANRIQAKIDSALLPEWGGTKMYEAKIIIPRDTVINIGKVAPQTIKSTGTVLRGGADQILLPENWPLEWIKEIRMVPAK